ncbi:NAD(+) synthase [Brachyspira sp.]|uniref:NAD(+) synthase n=1 Tax=Brachyspira sp. TaxID=1977261 RepID=UPI002636A79C|nr:NAD(+) synthase [Brachyspira sp.]
MKIAISQLEIIPSMPCDNAVRIISFISRAKKENADIVIFPELCVTGYMIGDMWESERFIAECEELGDEIIKSSKDIYVIFGNVAADRNKKNFDGRIRKYNAMFVAKDGKLIHNNSTEYPFIIKSLLPNYKEFEDSRHFFSLRDLAFENKVDVKEYLKPLEIECNGEKIKLGLTICEDIWSKNYLYSPMDIINTNKDVDLLINISSSHYSLIKDTERHNMHGAIASKYNMPFIYVNNVGIQNNGKSVYTFDGVSSVYDNNGNLLFAGNRYEEDLYFIDMDIKNKKFSKSIEIKDEDEYKSIYNTIIYGIRKFVKSIGVNKFVIGVSGGIDSALSAVMYVDAVGKDNVLLVNMPSKFNSDTTKNLAKTLADNLGCGYMVVPIQESVDYTVKQLENSPIIKDGKENNLKLSSFVIENIQARDRSSRVLSVIAAGFGGVFTCNANKTETMVGYSTMYGDGAGFFACLADLWKYQVYGLANYVNNEIYKKEIIPYGTINIIPSAELSFDQAVDEGKGDPIKYEYHDYLFKFLTESWNRYILENILEFYIDGVLENKLGCKAGILNKYFKNGIDFIDDLERWWKQFMGMGISKRIQAPPILSISKRSFGFGTRESQNRVYYTARYLHLKNKIIDLS